MEVKVLCPEYVKEFNCLGNACKYNCCREWYIHVTDQEYEYYKTLPNSEFKERLLESIVKNDGDAYRLECSKTTGKCNLLTEDNLCGVYINLSPEEMSYTCKIYPRQVHYMKDNIEVNLDLSCIEVTRLLFSRKEDLKFIVSDFELIERHNSFAFHSILKNEVKQKENYQDFYLYNYYEDLNSFCIKVLKYKKLSFDMRLMILGLFVKQIDSQPTNIELIIKEYEKEILNGGFDNLKNGNRFEEVFPKQLNVSTNIVSIILKKYNIALNKNFKIKKLLGEYLTQLHKFTDYYSIQTLKNNFKTALEKYNQYMAENNHIIENYIIHQVFVQKFPFDLESGCNSYKKLIVHYLIVKSSLLASFHYYEDDINLEHIMDNIMLLHRLIIRDPKKGTFKEVMDYLEKNNYLDLVSLFELIIE
ncbi:hypothetical protein AN396_03065 [Candidatus Epulonipiscium fishelsonii]|uniref:Uncharacterized protein n=1 Tax=Candidatus Epulonipiscium fishelsonii TaxID=77094 RepID=A0ACC8XEY2_9FIRM|nr:hypothetical protein AN396_03065 [Epulopiscium sp. SCG-B11WGA-EpuloA1]